jgi:hypothetical protein
LLHALVSIAGSAGLEDGDAERAGVWARAGAGGDRSDDRLGAVAARHTDRVGAVGDRSQPAIHDTWRPR